MKPPLTGFFALGFIRIVLVSLWLLAAARAAEEPKRKYDLRAGDAAMALREFSAVSGREILFAAEAVRGVRTSPVQGEFTAFEALTLMLAGTHLHAFQDERTGALAVRKRTESAPRSAFSSTTEPKSSVDPPANPMNSRNLATFFSALLFAPGPLLAQTVVPGASNLPDPEQDRVVELSPFVVHSDKDNGYQATSTLAGTRLNTPVKDLGAAISIYTKQFLEDIGATNSSELLIFATGMEAGGPGGNFAGVNTDVNATELVGSGVRENPQVSRTRGLASPNFTRGFFNTGIAFDAYNTDTVTVNRGPNAMLFGVGSAAGVVDTALLRPNLLNDSNKVTVRYGNNDSFRESVDFNRVLIPKHLAARLAALYDKEEYNQRPAFQEKKRIYGALTFEPFKATALRLNFESGRTRANRPITVLPVNNIPTAWFDAGRPGYDWTFYDNPARNPSASTQTAGAAFEGLLIAQTSIFDHPVWVYSQPGNVTPDFAFRSSVILNAGNVADTLKNGLFNPLLNRDSVADSIRFSMPRGSSDLPAAYWVGANVLPGQQPGVPPAGIKRQGFTDLSAFDFNHRMIDEGARQGDSFHAFNVALEQRAWGDRVGVELAYDKQRLDSLNSTIFFSHNISNAIFVDTNVTLPTGQANPNVGRPFMIGRNIWQRGMSERESVRATGYLKYDFKDLRAPWGRWLGRHALTGLYEQDIHNNISYGYRFSTDGPAARAINASIGVEARAPRPIVYIGPSLIGNNNPLRLEPARIPLMEPGPAVPVQYFTRQANDTDPGSVVAAPTTFVEYNQGGAAQRDVIRSQSAVLQSYWFQNLLGTLVGWRRDEDYFIRQTIVSPVNPANLNDPGKVHHGFNDYSFPRTPPLNVAQESISYSGVLRWPKRLVPLPAGTDFSVFYNQSDNFTPIGGRINAYGQALASPQGQTKEYGLNFSALNDRLNLRVNWFETAVQGQSQSTTAYSEATNANIFAIAGAWSTEGNINPHLVARANADIALLFSPLPANYQQLYNYTVSGTAPNISYSRGNLIGITDTTDFTAKGTEIELTFNPTRRWRILANVAKQETVKSNSLPFLKEFIALMKPVWDQLRDRPRTNYPLGWQPGDPITYARFGDWIDSTVMVPFATAIATEGSASAEQRKWRANLVTNYTFGRDALFGEKLKGWGIGGAVRWQDKLGIGYPTSREPNGTVNIDIAHPYYAPAETNVDAWVSYERKIWKNRINWKVQLNANNVIGGTDPIAIGVQPWGEIASARIAPERRWHLSNTFSF